MKDNEDAVKAVVENFIISGILDEEFKAEKFIENCQATSFVVTKLDIKPH